MISYKNKFILITPQKTGSTSLVTALKDYIVIKPRLDPDHQGLRGIIPVDFKSENFDYGDEFHTNYAKHNKLSTYYDGWDTVKALKQSNILPWDDMGEIDNYFTAGVIRNPFDRVVSWWGKEDPLLEFINSIPTIRARTSGQNHRDAQLSLWPWFGVYVDEDFDSAGLTEAELRVNRHIKKNISETPQLVEIHLDMFCIRFENLQESFDAFCDKVNIPRQVLPHKNKSDRKHYTEYYDTESRELVEQLFAKDLEYFGYKFGD